MTYATPRFWRELLSGRIPPPKSGTYLRYVKSQPCCVRACDQEGPSEPHHVVNEFKAKGSKNSDYWTIPLCRFHHEEYTVDRAEATLRYGSEWMFVCVMLLQAIVEGVLVMRGRAD